MVSALKIGNRVTFLHAPFLFLLHQSGILYLHMFALSTISVHLSDILNHIFSSQLSLPSHSVPAPPIRSSRFRRSINLVVCMYVCNDVCILLQLLEDVVPRSTTSAWPRSLLLDFRPSDPFGYSRQMKISGAAKQWTWWCAIFLSLLS